MKLESPFLLGFFNNRTVKCMYSWRKNSTRYKNENLIVSQATFLGRTIISINFAFLTWRLRVTVIRDTYMSTSRRLELFKGFNDVKYQIAQKLCETSWFQRIDVKKSNKNIFLQHNPSNNRNLNGKRKIPFLLDFRILVLVIDKLAHFFENIFFST